MVCFYVFEVDHLFLVGGVMVLIRHRVARDIFLPVGDDAMR